MRYEVSKKTLERLLLLFQRKLETVKRKSSKEKRERKSSGRCEEEEVHKVGEGEVALSTRRIITPESRVYKLG